uniref:Uncharacterized protein n=1 Tax=Rhizophora mucronata TaxID=61149 RepID=A0A2P2PWT5_RHIMU
MAINGGLKSTGSLDFVGGDCWLGLVIVTAKGDGARREWRWRWCCSGEGAGDVPVAITIVLYQSGC